MENKDKKRSFFTVISTIQCILYTIIAVLFILYFWTKITDVFDSSILFVAATGLAYILSHVIHTFVHEAGHLLFGLLTGYRFVSFKAFNVIFVKSNGKIRRKRAIVIPGIVGQCLMAPPDIKNGKMPFFLYNLGGSLLNLIVGGVFLVLYYVLSDMYVISAFMITFAIIGFLMAILNIVPMSTGSIDNDGLNTVRVVKNKNLLRILWIQLKVAEQGASGVRLRDLPEEWFFIPSLEDMEGGLSSAVGILSYTRLLELGKLDEATKAIGSMLAPELGICGLHRALLIQDRIYAELMGNKDKKLINNLLASKEIALLDRIKNDISPFRVKYAMALLYENNADKANWIEKEFNNVALTFPYPADIEQERDLMAMAKSRYETELKEKINE